MQKHTLPPKDLDLKKALHEERHLLQEAQVPIITISATYRKELAKKYKSLVHTPSDVIYSRAHYSMAEAVRQQAIRQHKSTHLSDPTNFVSQKQWGKIEFTEIAGQTMARHKPLKWLKDQVDTVVRDKLPIAEAITPPLLYLTGNTKCPVISMHYETGNILAHAGKTVIQVITDPHIRPQYLNSLPNNNITFAVFDSQTKTDFYKTATSLGKSVSQKQVIVTGSPVDPRIVSIGKTPKHIHKNKPINIAITTGGLGTNLPEIKQVLGQFEPLLRPPEKVRLFLYAGNHKDFRDFFEKYAEENNVRIGNLDEQEARIRILYDDSIIDANNNLIKYAFPWAHGFITKPSGDMTYDAAAAGCFLLFLEPWGEWEKNIQKRFIKNTIGHDLHVDNAYDHFNQLKGKGILEKSIKYAQKLPDIFREGCKNILNLHASFPC